MTFSMWCAPTISVYEDLADAMSAFCIGSSSLQYDSPSHERLNQMFIVSHQVTTLSAGQFIIEYLETPDYGPRRE